VVLARVRVLPHRGEIEPGSRGFAQFRLETPTVALHGDRFVLRSYSPQATIGGGLVLEPEAVRHRRRDFRAVSDKLFDLKSVINDPVKTLETFVTAAQEQGVRIDDFRAKTGWTKTVSDNAVATSRSVTAAGDILMGKTVIESIRSRALKAIAAFHRSDRLSKGISRELLHDRVSTNVPNDVIALVVAKLQADGAILIDADSIKVAGHEQKLTSEEQQARDTLVETFRSSGLGPVRIDEIISAAAIHSKLSEENVRRILKTLLEAGEVVKVSEEFYFSQKSIDELRTKLSKFAENSSDRLIDVAQFKDLAGVSRKYAIPLLEYFDREKVTVRSGDKRIILR
jgi:selenocysteine-specific elongation factor